ncbi:MAG TPA: hypothetical protein PKX46_04905 [Clostridia bacterium]|nr:hypothetical protein [Clostridia bacterium]HOR13244.1 hypothetical protein [Clostridia bacterium]
MGLRKCPRCELNYIREDEKFCNVCRREITGETDEAEETQNLCQECGENLAAPGQELCTYCLNERRRRQKLQSLIAHPPKIEVDMTQLDEIDVPLPNDIPSDDLQDIHKEFGDDSQEEDEEDDESESEEAEDEFDED